MPNQNFIPNQQSQMTNNLNGMSMNNNSFFGANNSLPNSNSIGYLNAKVIDNERIIDVTEVPFGGSGLFVMADMSKVFVKVWGNNAQTRVIEYRPYFAPVPTETPDSLSSTSIEVLMEKMAQLENKLDTVLNGEQSNNTQKMSVEDKEVF